MLCSDNQIFGVSRLYPDFWPGQLEDTSNTIFANLIRTTYGGGMKCDCNQICTDASLVRFQRIICAIQCVKWQPYQIQSSKGWHQSRYHSKPCRYQSNPIWTQLWKIENCGETLHLIWETNPICLLSEHTGLSNLIHQGSVLAAGFHCKQPAAHLLFHLFKICHLVILHTTDDMLLLGWNKKLHPNRPFPDKIRQIRPLIYFVHP